MTLLSRSVNRSSVLKSSVSVSTSTKWLNLARLSNIAAASSSPSATSISIPLSISTRRLFATTSASKPKRAASATKSSPKKPTTKATSKSNAKPKPTKKAAEKKKPAVKKKPVVKKKVAKPKPKAEKLKPWQARGEDGKLLPLPSASKPTRRTSFILFLAERMPAAKASGDFLKKSPKTGNDILDLPAMTKALGSEWRALSASQKQKYEELAEVEKGSYERALAAWTAALSPEDIRRQNAYVTAQKKAGKKAIGRVTDVNKPKRPQSAFFLFLSDRRKTSDPNVKITEQVKTAASEWKSMSKEEKDEYEKRAAGPQKQYKLEMEEYKKSLSV